MRVYPANALLAVYYFLWPAWLVEVYSMFPWLIAEMESETDSWSTPSLNASVTETNHSTAHYSYKTSDWSWHRMHSWMRAVESRPYAPPPPPVGMLACIGEGDYTRDRYISSWRPLPTVECHVGARSLYFLWLFDGQNSRKSTKWGIIWHKELVASCSYCFCWLMDASIYISWSGTRDTTTYAGTWAKSTGGEGLCSRGRNCGILW